MICDKTAAGTAHEHACRYDHDDEDAEDYSFGSPTTHTCECGVRWIAVA